MRMKPLATLLQTKILTDHSPPFLRNSFAIVSGCNENAIFATLQPILKLCCAKIDAIMRVQQPSSYFLDGPRNGTTNGRNDCAWPHLDNVMTATNQYSADRQTITAIK